MIQVVKHIVVYSGDDYDIWAFPVRVQLGWFSSLPGRAVLPQLIAFLKTSRVGQLVVACLHPVPGHFKVMSGEFSQFGQQLTYIREPGDEPPVVRTQPQKTPQLVFVDRSWPALHSFQFFGARGYSWRRNDVTQVSYLLSEQLARLRVQFQVGIIIIIFINCNWVITRWQWLYYMYTNMERKKKSS